MTFTNFIKVQDTSLQWKSITNNGTTSTTIKIATLIYFLILLLFLSILIATIWHCHIGEYINTEHLHPSRKATKGGEERDLGDVSSTSTFHESN